VARSNWSLGRQPVRYLEHVSAHVTFGLWRGASIHHRPDGCRAAATSWPTPGCAPSTDIDAGVFADWLAQARALGEV